MSSNIEIKINGEKICDKPVKQKTDLQLAKKLPIQAIYYSFDGNYKDRKTFKTEDEAYLVLSHPNYAGCTVDIYVHTARKRAKLELEDTK